MLHRHLPFKHTEMMYLEYFVQMALLTKACGAHLDSFAQNAMDLMAFERALANVRINYFVC